MGRGKAMKRASNFTYLIVICLPSFFTSPRKAQPVRFGVPLNRWKIGLATLSLTALLVFQALPSNAQSLLETWVFLDNSGFFDIGDLKENPTGTLVVPHHQQIEGGESTWKLKDKQNCVLREERKNGSWTEHYLNNVLPNRFAYFDREWGVYKILLEGDENVKCVYDPTDNREPHRCYKTEIIGVLDNELEVLHFERAINYVYTNFCHYARASKPF